jgi:hypothetical protein
MVAINMTLDGFCDHRVELAVIQAYPNTSKDAEIFGLYWDSVITCWPWAILVDSFKGVFSPYFKDRRFL